MKFIKVTSIVFGLFAVISGAVPSAGAASSPPFFTRSFDPRAVIELIYSGRVDSALTVIESVVRENPDDPFALLIKAKVLRERLNDEDNNKERIRAGAEPIQDVIDRALELCDVELEKADPDPRFHFYRGYGWLGKSQMYVLTRSYWSAGRAASHGKSELERYLEAYPDDPDAQGLLGAYLYFADAIPGFIKIVAKLFFIPGGDRDKGLEMLQRAASNGGLFSEDFKMILAAIDMVFEGRFEDGSAAFVSLLERYPYYTRLAEPIGVVIPFSPLAKQDLGRAEARAISDYTAIGDPARDWSIVQRLRLNRTFSEMYFGSPASAMDRFTVLIGAPPDHPDWFLPIATLNLGYYYQKTGEKGKARVAFESVRSNPAMSYYHSVAETMMESLDDPVKVVYLDDLGFIRQIYHDRPDSAETGLQSYRRAYGEDALYFFYEGDRNVFQQDFLAAEHNFERALECREFGGDQIYQMFAAIRLAEISGMRGRYDDARNYLEKAKKYCYANYLINFMIRSRNRYYQLLDDGVIDTSSTLLLRSSGTDP